MLNPLVPSPGLFVVDEYFNGVRGVIISLVIEASGNQLRLVRTRDYTGLWVYDYDFSEPRTVPWFVADWSPLIDLLGLVDFTAGQSIFTNSINRTQLRGRAYFIDD